MNDAKKNSTTKNDAKRERSFDFARVITEHNPGMTPEEIQQKIGLKDERDSMSGGVASGRTLRRWLAGEGAQTLNDLQHYAAVAIKNGLLPPLREGCLHRADIFGAETVQLADETFDVQRKQLEDVKKKRGAAIRALKDYAAASAALEDDAGVLILEASSWQGELQFSERTSTDMLTLAERISGHVEHKLF
jgi:hypothetical protein